MHDRNHTPHHLQTTLTSAQEAVAVVLRKTLLVSIDDLLALAIGLEPMVPSMARSGSFSAQASRVLVWMRCVQQEQKLSARTCRSSTAACTLAHPKHFLRRGRSQLQRRTGNTRRGRVIRVNGRPADPVRYITYLEWGPT